MTKWIEGVTNLTPSRIPPSPLPMLMPPRLIYLDGTFINPQLLAFRGNPLIK